LTAKLTASADGSKVLIGTAAEDALEIDANAKTIKALSPYASIPRVPLVYAYTSALYQFAKNVWTKLVFQSESVDTNGFWNDSARFQPTVAGWYQIIVRAQVTEAVTFAMTRIVKNGTAEANVANYGSGNISSPANSNISSSVNALVYLNGSTDWIEVQGIFDTAGATVTLLQGLEFSYFQAILARGA
jgi:hypothetical protein